MNAMQKQSDRVFAGLMLLLGLVNAYLAVIHVGSPVHLALDVLFAVIGFATCVFVVFRSRLWR